MTSPPSQLPESGPGVNPAEPDRTVQVAVGADGERVVILTPEQYAELQARGEAPPVTDSAYLPAPTLNEEAARNTALDKAVRRMQLKRFMRSPVRHRPATLLNRSERVGRNDPCPCGSGAKWKKCCYASARPGGLLGTRPS